ncbi:MAG: aspartate kinase [Oscillospiraceae bacterium]|nr:aspartate kinase [Oscillospiraceae bacterium]
MNTSEKYVVKFGGSSLASAEQFKKVCDIIKSDERRRYIVPSAPGKRCNDDTKVTDMLYACYDAVALHNKDATVEFEPIKKRFDGIIADLGLASVLSLDNEYEQICENFKQKAGSDYAASRGEYLNGIILAKYLDFEFIDAAKVIKFKSAKSNVGRVFDAELTNAALATMLSKKPYAVIPGFYGASPSGKIKTFSRGGSDFTGSIVARSVNANLYENWTDVSGFLAADPRIVDNPEIIRVITYRELRELSYMGATVLHEDAIFPVREANIPINIRNTNAPFERGTLIVHNSLDFEETSDTPIITGIAGKKDFSVISIDKDGMNNEIGFLRRILTLFEELDVNFEHIPTGIDTLCIVLESSELDKHESLPEQIRQVAGINHIVVESGLAMLAVVGRGMREKRGTAARIFAALAHNGINARIIDQGSSELNVIIGIVEDDFNKAIRSIYDIFFNTKP